MLRCLIDGNSIRATSRIAGVAINSVIRLLVDAGRICSQYQHETMQDLTCTRLEIDEIWSFIYAKEKNVRRAVSPPPEAGDAWTWTAICADTKLVPTWLIGDRSAATAFPFMQDLATRLRNRVQFTTDGHRAYLTAVRGAFGGDVDYAMLIKVYGGDSGATGAAHRRYSPGQYNGSERKVVSGSPDHDLISTSYAERNNLTMRMSMRRFTRLTNAFSKKLPNHAAQVALHFFNYNCRKHTTIKTTPAMAAGIEDRVWSVEDLVRLIDDRTPKPGPRGPYKVS